MIEAVTTTQTMKNLAYAGAAVGITAVGYLGWKTFHEVKTGDEASVFNLLTKEGRNKQTERIRKDPKGTFLKVFFDPTGLNPFI